MGQQSRSTRSEESEEDQDGKDSRNRVRFAGRCRRGARRRRGLQARGLVLRDRTRGGVREVQARRDPELRGAAAGTCDLRGLRRGLALDGGRGCRQVNAMPKYVVSSTLEEPLDWNNSSVLKGDVVEEVSRLRQSLRGDIVIHGSPQLVQTLIEHDLVDELRMTVFPVVLGTGKRLFGDSNNKKRLRLTDSKVAGDGIAILIYEPAGTEEGATNSQQQ
ncbi:MAG TPA: dihydrofolate reductase family protein [Rubrobacter sp.]|nr:dihydrofolate reductase family protein [Rubrobacter sp.]